MSYNFNKLLLLILFCSLTSHIFGQFDNSHYKLTRVDLKNTSIEAIARLGLEADHGFYAPGRFWMNYLNEEETNLLKEHHIDYTHVETDFLKTLERNNYSCEKTIDQITDPKRFRLGTMAGYYTYEDMNAILDTMRMLYPHLISQRFDIDTFKTFEGRPIQWLRISNNPDQTQSKPRVLYTALHHAREPMSLSQLIYYIWYLLEHYDSDAEYNPDSLQKDYLLEPYIPDSDLHLSATSSPIGSFYSDYYFEDLRHCRHLPYQYIGSHQVQIRYYHRCDWHTVALSLIISPLSLQLLYLNPVKCEILK